MHRLSTEGRDALALICSLAVALIVFSSLIWVDGRAAAARGREAHDALRGDFVDRNGRPLVMTTEIAGRVSRRDLLPSLTLPIGYRDASGRWHGLEARYSTFLDASHAKHDWHTFFLHLRGASVHGGTVQLTLDSRLQNAADRALGRNKGAIVVLQPQTGDVLALVSKPYCSSALLESRAGLARCQHDSSRPLLNRATQLLLPPGSAFKIVTLSAALDTKRFSLHSVFRGTDAFGPSPLFDNVTYPSNVTRTDLQQLTLAQALAFSDNFTFAHIGVTLGARTLLRYAHRFLIGHAIPFDLPTARSSIADGRAHPTEAEVAQSSFGAEVDHVTALQMALIAATVANGGRLMAPHLIKNLKDASGKVVYRYPIHPLSRVMSAGAARQVAAGMEFVVEHGSGYLAQIAGIKVAAKTGTAASGAYYPHAWFICFAPVDHPVVAIAVLREYAGEAFKYAAPIARRVMVAALQEYGYRVK